jgi:uncharacterized BrkB/YihY/UPF0761 family membrane protein
MVIASQAFTALILLLILVAAVAPTTRNDLVARGVINRFDLGGDAAVAVQRLFEHSSEGSVGVLSMVLLVFSGVSLTRRLQRMYLLAWRLEPLSGIRGSFNAGLGLVFLVMELVLLSFARSFVRGLPVDGLLAFVLSTAAGIVLWTSVPWLLMDRRVAWRRLLLAGVLASTAISLYGTVTSLYMPRLMERYSERYGLFGISLALVGWLLAVTLILVTTTVIAAELDRTRRPERVPDRSELPRQG